MTVKELHTFTNAEMEVIADALKIANAHYRTLAEVSQTRYASEFRQEFERQAEEASALQLKIEAAQ